MISDLMRVRASLSFSCENGQAFGLVVIAEREGERERQIDR
jgi:hypothetical protein